MTKQYNAKECTFTVDDVIITGFGESMVSGSKDEDDFEAVVGAQGDVIINERNNDLGTVTATVQATCPQYNFLLELARNRRVVPVWATNKSLGERFGGTKARILKVPDVKTGAKAEDRELQFKVFDYVVEPA